MWCKRECLTRQPVRNQLLREIQELKNRQEVVVAPAPPPPKYSDSVQNWRKGLQTVAYDIRTGSPRDGLF